MTVFHNLCRDYHEITPPPLDCARSGYLHTICSVVTQKEDFITTTQTAVSTILGHVFTQTGFDRAAVSPTTLAALAPASHTISTSVRRFHASASHTSSISDCRSLASANHTSSNKIPRSSSDLGYPAWCSSSFHLTSPRSILGGLLLLTAVI